MPVPFRIMIFILHPNKSTIMPEAFFINFFWIIDDFFVLLVTIESITQFKVNIAMNLFVTTNLCSVKCLIMIQ